MGMLEDLQQQRDEAVALAAEYSVKLDEAVALLTVATAAAVAPKPGTQPPAAPRDPGPRSASRSRRGSRFTLIPSRAWADASAPAQATGRRHVSAMARRAEIRLTVLE